MKKILLTVLILCFLSVSGFAQKSQKVSSDANTLTKEQCIRMYMDTIEKDRLQKFFQTFIGQLQSSFPELREQEVGTYFRDVFLKFNYDDISNDIYVIYDKHLDYDTIKSVVDFYNSPSGVKITQAMPKIMADILETSTKFAKLIMDEMMKEMDGGTRITSNINNSSKSKPGQGMNSKRQLAYELLNLDGRYEAISAFYDKQLFEISNLPNANGNAMTGRIQAKISKQEFLNEMLDAYAKRLDEKTLSDWVNFEKSPEKERFDEIYNEKIASEIEPIYEEYFEKLTGPALEKLKNSLKKRLDN